MGKGEQGKIERILLESSLGVWSKHQLIGGCLPSPTPISPLLLAVYPDPLRSGWYCKPQNRRQRTTAPLLRSATAAPTPTPTPTSTHSVTSAPPTPTTPTAPTAPTATSSTRRTTTGTTTTTTAPTALSLR